MTDNNRAQTPRHKYGRKQLTLIRFADIVFFFQGSRLGGVVNMQGNLHLGV
jgi:hypothetical protein